MYQPTLTTLPINIAMSAGFGYAIGSFARTSPIQCAQIVAITTLSHQIFTAVTNSSSTNLNEKYISFLISSYFASLFGTYLLNSYDLIDTSFGSGLVALATWRLYCRFNENEIDRYNAMPEF